MLAWALPVVAVANAVPAAAASGTVPTIAFSSASYTNASGLSCLTLTGPATKARGGSYPASVALTYTNGLSGPVSTSVDQATGAHTVSYVATTYGLSVTQLIG